MARPRRRIKKSEGFYKHAVRVLRHGFIDSVETDDYNVTPGTSKTQAIRDLKRHGYPIGKEIDYNERTGVLVDVRRTGNLARGFTGADGYDLSRIDEWTPQQKSKVTRLFRVVSRLSARPFQLYRARKPENLLTVQRAAQHHAFPPELAVAFVPVGRPGEKARVRITQRTTTVTRDGEPVMVKGKPKVKIRMQVDIRERQVKHTPTLWEDVGLTMADVARDPAAAVRKIVNEIGGKTFTLLAGTTEFKRTYGPKGLEKEIVRVMNTYDEEWQFFLFGIQAFEMPQPADLSDYRKAKREAKAVVDAFRAKARKFFRRMYGKKKRSKKK